MNITITKSNLLALLNICGSVAKAKSPHAYLECVKLDAADQKLSGYATDLIRDISTSVECDVKAPGSLAVSVKALVERTKTMPEGPISIVADGSTLVLKSGKRRHVVPFMPAADYPKVAASPETMTAEVPAKALARLLNCSRHASGDNPTQPHLYGVRLTARDGKLVAVASEGHHGAVVRADWDGPSFGFMLSADSIGAVTSILSSGAESVRLGVSPTRSTFTGGATSFGSAIPEGRFPEEAILGAPGVSTSPDFTAIVDRATFADAVRSVQTASATGVLRGLLSLSLSAGKIQLSAASEHGQAEDELDAEYDGPTAKIGAFAQYLLDACAAIDSARIRIGFAADWAIILIRPLEGEDNIQIVMPTQQ